MGHHHRHGTATLLHSSANSSSFLAAEKVMAKNESLMISSSLIQVSTWRLLLLIILSRKMTDLYLFYVYRKTALVPAESWQEQATAAEDGPLKLALEWLSDHYLRWVEWLLGSVRCHLYRLEERRREVVFQYSINNPRGSPHEIVPHCKCHWKYDVCLWWWWRQILA